ncbi:MAG: hypothetical protein P8130_09030 [Deltaproteobacteria bacterium]
MGCKLADLLRPRLRLGGRVGLMAVLLLSISSCATELPSLQRLRPLPSDDRVCRVAVLPFTSESDYPESAAIATKVITAELNTLGNYIVTQQGDVDKLYLQLRILPGSSPSREQMQILASRLNAQLLFTGHVIRMRENPNIGGGVNPVLAIRVDILDGRNAEVLWSIYHRRQGLDYQKAMQFGVINSMAGLCKQVGLEIINLTLEKGLPKCDVPPQF